MSIGILQNLLAPPDNPMEVGTPDGWLQIEAILGTNLPEDYKSFISLYGSGSIDGFLEIYNPFSANPYLNFLECVPKLLDAQRSIKEQWGESECPYLLYPELHGILPWAITANGDSLYWQMVGEPDEWIIVINESRGPMWEQYTESATTFITKYINGELSSEIIGNEVLSRNSVFEPLSWREQLSLDQWNQNLHSFQEWLKNKTNL